MHRIQILGQKEINFLHQLTREERKVRSDNIVNYHPPCFIVTTQQEGLTYLIEHCSEEGIPLLRTPDRTADFVAKLNSFISKALAPERVIHGVCINVFGMGILLRGKSCDGESEVAHTLIGRRHRLDADDIVILIMLSTLTILGSHNHKK